MFGWHSETPHVAPYLVPQECGCHMDSESMTLVCGGAELAIEKCGEPFAFSALPNTPRELEAALHREELPASKRTVVSIFGAVRGVGGIDTWGNDVEPAYHISAEKDIALRFCVRL